MKRTATPHTPAPAASAPAAPGSGVTRAEHCVIACAEAWRGDGEILAAPMGTIPRIAAKLARRTFAPELLLTDGEALLTREDPDPAPGPKDAAPDTVEGWLPYRKHLTLTAGGKRHVMMGASQLDQYGNQNISAIGDPHRPRRQLLGARGAPVNTLNNPVSYWIPRHSPRVLVPRVDVVSGVGHDRAAEAGPSATRFHELRRVVTDLAVLDFATPDHRMRLVSVHPGVTVEEVRERTGFALALPEGAREGEVPYTRDPTPEELRLVREVIDPHAAREREVSP